MVKNFFSATFVSLEFLVIMVVVFLYLSFPGEIEDLGKRLRSDDEVWKYMPALTFALAVTAINFSSKIRAPLESGTNKLLYDWPGYGLLIGRVYVGMFFGISSAVIALFVWIFGKGWSDLLIGGVSLCSASVAGVSALSMILAHQKLRELIEKYG